MVEPHISTRNLPGYWEWWFISIKIANMQLENSILRFPTSFYKKATKQIFGGFNFRIDIDPPLTN